jgi:predicted MFS family arabinose efflux permease
MALFGVALIGFSRLDQSSDFWNMAPWLLVGGVGFGLIMPPMTAAILDTTDVDKAGVASGVMQVFRQLGGGLGVAIMGAVVTAKLNGLTPGRPGYAGDFADAFQTITLAAAIISFASAVLAFLIIRQPRHLAAGETTAVTQGGAR